MQEPVTVGIIGAGPWAALLHAPLLAAGPATSLAGVHARRPEAAAELAAKHGAPSFDRLEDLLEVSDVVAIAVAPDAQPGYARAAAAAGVPLLLDKPLALDLPAAEALAADLGDHPALVLLTLRFSQAAGALRADAERVGASEAAASWRSGAFLAGPFSHSPWRHEQGALLDVGPHCLDLLAQALGPIEAVESATGERTGRVDLRLRHVSGATSTAALDCRSTDGDESVIVATGPGGEARFSAADAFGSATFAALSAGLVALGRAEALDPSWPTIADALAAQRVITEAGALLQD